jgi:hypothetical protein
MKQFFLFFLFCFGLTAQAMEAPSKMLMQGLSYPPLLEELEGDLDSGIDINHHHHPQGLILLMLAAKSGHVDACELLIQRGAAVGISDLFTGQTALMIAATWGKKEVINVLLTTIPLLVSKFIKLCMPGLIGLRYAQPELPKSVCRLIGQKLIDLLVQEQLPRIECLIALTEDKTHLPIEKIISRSLYISTPEKQEIARMFDLSNPQLRKKLLAQLDVNTKRILFGEPSVIKIRRANQKSVI